MTDELGSLLSRISNIQPQLGLESKRGSSKSANSRMLPRKRTWSL